MSAPTKRTSFHEWVTPIKRWVGGKDQSPSPPPCASVNRPAPSARTPPPPMLDFQHPFSSHFVYDTQDVTIEAALESFFAPSELDDEFGLAESTSTTSGASTLYLSTPRSSLTLYRYSKMDLYSDTESIASDTQYETTVVTATAVRLVLTASESGSNCSTEVNPDSSPAPTTKTHHCKATICSITPSAAFEDDSDGFFEADDFWLYAQSLVLYVG